MPSNAEILAQLEKLAEARRPQCVPALNAADEDGDTYCRHCGVGMYVGEQRWRQSQLNPIVPILAAFKRLLKIEEAAKRCDFEGLAEYFDTEQFIYKRWGGERGSCELQNDLRALDAALKQGNQ